MLNSLRRQLTIALCFAAALCFTAAPAQQASLAGEEITLIVPFKAGGGTDRWARFWAPLIAERLPGQPKIKVRNIVGGGSTRGANRFALTAQDDGLTLLASSASVLFPYLLGDSRVEYDYDQWEALLASGTGGLVYAGHDAVNEDGQLYEFEPHMLLQGPAQIGVLLMLSMEMLEIDYSVDFGASGASAAYRAFTSGITDVNLETTSAYLGHSEDLMKHAKALFTLGELRPDGTLVRDRMFADHPHFVEYYRQLNGGKEPEGLVYETWREFFEAGFPAQKMLILPQATDPAIKQAYIAAIEEVIEDTSIMPAARTEVLGTYPQYSGTEAQRLMRSATHISQETRNWYKDWVSSKFNIRL